MITALRLRKNFLSLFSLTISSSSLLKPQCKSHLHLVLEGHHFSTSATTPNPTVYEFLVHTHNFSSKSALQIASVLPTPFSNPQRSDSTLSFFKQTGFSISQLERTVKVCPWLLSANFDRVIKPKFKLLHDLGLSGSDVAKIVARDPVILARSLNNRVIPNVCVLNNLLGSKDEVARILKVSSWFLSFDLDDSLVPNVEFFRNCGVSMDQIRAMMHPSPRFMLCKFGTMKKSRTDAMGVNRSSRMFIHAVRVIGSMTTENWELKLRSFREVGFSDDHITAVLRKSPYVLCLSEDKIKKTKEVILATGKYNISNIVKNPASLGLSIEKRYVPRFRVLELLEGKNLIQSWPRFWKLCSMKDKEFFDTYVAPFCDEIGDVYMVSSASATKLK